MTELTYQEYAEKYIEATAYHKQAKLNPDTLFAEFPKMVLAYMEGKGFHKVQAFRSPSKENTFVIPLNPTTIEKWAPHLKEPRKLSVSGAVIYIVGQYSPNALYLITPASQTVSHLTTRMFNIIRSMGSLMTNLDSKLDLAKVLEMKAYMLLNPLIWDTLDVIAPTIPARLHYTFMSLLKTNQVTFNDILMEGNEVSPVCNRFINDALGLVRDEIYRETAIPYEIIKLMLNDALFSLPEKPIAFESNLYPLSAFQFIALCEHRNTDIQFKGLVEMKSPFAVELANDEVKEIFYSLINPDAYIECCEDASAVVLSLSEHLYWYLEEQENTKIMLTDYDETVDAPSYLMGYTIKPKAGLALAMAFTELSATDIEVQILNEENTEFNVKLTDSHYVLNLSLTGEPALLSIIHKHEGPVGYWVEAEELQQLLKPLMKFHKFGVKPYEPAVTIRSVLQQIDCFLTSLA